MGSQVWEGETNMLYFWVLVGSGALVSGLAVSRVENDQAGAKFRLSETSASAVGNPHDSRGDESRDSHRVARGANTPPGREPAQQEGVHRAQQVRGEDGRTVSVDIARILRVAGTKPIAVDPSGSYSGRRRLSDGLDLNPHAAAAVAEGQLAAEQGQEEGRRNFGDIASILRAASARPIAVDPSGSYSGRRRRSDGLDLNL